MENSSDGSLDLLSAALNQSGLMNGDILSPQANEATDESGMLSELLDNPLLAALGNEPDSLMHGTLVKNDFGSAPLPSGPTPSVASTMSVTTVSNNLTSEVKSATMQPSLQPVKSIRLAKPLPGCKVTSISGVKILKLPTLKAGSIIKIGKLGKASIIQSDSKLLSDVGRGKNGPTALAESVLPNNGLKTSIHVVKSLDVTKTSSGPNTTVKKAIVNDKTVFIPVHEARVVGENKAKVTTIKTIPVSSVVRTASHNVPSLVKSKSFSLGNVSSNQAFAQQTSMHSTAKSKSRINTSGMKLTLTDDSETRNCNSPSLNLGSMFVESAEKAVSSDFETPPASPYSMVLNSTNKQDNDSLKSEKYSIHQPPTLSRYYSTKIKAINGSAQFYEHLKLSSLNSIPSNDLTRGTDRPILEKSTLYGNKALPRTLSLPAMPKQSGEELVAEDEKEEESEMQNAQTYAEYMPSKLQIGLPHPDSVVETSSLASINPPDVHYRLSIPREAIDLCRLSALQLECVTYASQKHNTFLRSGERAGYLIGDGAGVGKGRSVAGIIYENYLVGRKRALWFSVSNDLRYDAERDLRDIGAKHIKVYPLNKFKYGKITARNNGAVKKGVVFATYSSLIGESHFQAKYHTRLKQILHWCGEDFDGVIIFDECHKAKNLVPSGAGKSTKTGITVLELQKQLPNARVVYASATGASEPRNMAYMSRLGLWGPGTPFPDFMDFIQAVERRGVGAMELVAMDMKLRGSYMARQLSFYGVSFKINEVSLDSSFVQMYNKTVKLWVAAREAFQAAASMMEAEYHMKKSMWAMFWSAHQRFYKYLCISAKVKHTVSLVREAVKHGKCVVIGMQSTGESGTIDQLDKCGGELDDFVSTAKTVFENLIERHFPAPDRKRVAALFGKDFYKRSNTEQEKVAALKRKMPLNGESSRPSKKPRRGSESSGDGATSTSESDQEDQLSDDDRFSHTSLDSTASDEDIGRIFGDASDSEDNDSPVKKKTAKSRKRSVTPDRKDDPCDDAGLTLEGLKHANHEEGTDLLSGIDAVSGTLTSSLPGMGTVERAQALKRELLNRLEALGPSLPNNMLDELIDALGGPENVAEMTGRKGRVIATDDGNVEYQSRAENDVPVELLNMKEKQRFMDGEKNIAIISEAASSGISLQADKRARNQRRRVHVTLELPWSADRAIQQFGRTHRSNQVNAPEYVFLITELAGEQRFASVVAKRLESLGALTHGDRRATETRDLSKYNYDNKYGRKALDSVMKAIAGYDAPLIPPPSSYKGQFFKDIRQGLLGVGLLTREIGQTHYQLDKDYNNIFKFMNRMLGMEVDQQNALFQFFSDSMDAIILEAKRLGQYDQGIVDVGSGGDSVERVKCRDFPIASGGTASLHTVRVERGTSWEEALKTYNESSVGEDSGFYVTFQKKNGKHMVILAIEYRSRRYRGPSLFLIYRPNTGRQTRRETLDDIKKKYRRCDEEEEAERWWTHHHQAALQQCTHEFWQGVCNRGGTASCHVGKRLRTYHVLAGSVLGVWRTVEYVLSVEGGNKYKMQIVRLKTSDGGKLVGLLIPSNCTASLIAALSSEAHNPDQSHDATSLTVSTNPCDVISDDSDDYEDVDEIEPDKTHSTVLFSERQFSWAT